MIFKGSGLGIGDILADTIFADKMRSATERERELLIEIAKTEDSLVSPSDFPRFSGASVLLSRLERKEFLVRYGRGKYSLFHPLFSEYLKKQ